LICQSLGYSVALICFFVVDLVICLFIYLLNRTVRYITDNFSFFLVGFGWLGAGHCTWLFARDLCVICAFVRVVCASFARCLCVIFALFALCICVIEAFAKTCKNKV